MYTFVKWALSLDEPKLCSEPGCSQVCFPLPWYRTQPSGIEKTFISQLHFHQWWFQRCCATFLCTYKSWYVWFARLLHVQQQVLPTSSGETSHSAGHISQPHSTTHWHNRPAEVSNKHITQHHTFHIVHKDSSELFLVTRLGNAKNLLSRRSILIHNWLSDYKRLWPLLPIAASSPFKVSYTRY